jgi:hypothetical protein
MESGSNFVIKFSAFHSSYQDLLTHWRSDPSCGIDGKSPWIYPFSGILASSVLFHQWPAELLGLLLLGLTFSISSRSASTFVNETP